MIDENIQYLKDLAITTESSASSNTSYIMSSVEGSLDASYDSNIVSTGIRDSSVQINQATNQR